MKEVVVDKPTKKIKYIQFGVLSPSEIEATAVTEIYQKNFYNLQEKKPSEGGVLDRRLGISNKEDSCETCMKKLQDCAGHFGYIRLVLPIFHAGYFKATLSILQQICKTCSRVLMDEKQKRVYMKKLQAMGMDNPQKMNILKQISTECKKTHTCPYCQSINGTVKKVGVLKLIHEKFRFAKKTQEAFDYVHSFQSALENMPELKPHYQKAADDLNPLRVYQLFKRITAEDCYLLGLDPEHARPELFLWTHVPVPPICIRPSVAMDKGEAGSNEDDLTVKLAEVITLNYFLEKSIQEGEPLPKLMEDWDFMQLICAQYVNSEMPGLSNASQANRWIRGICQRLKGKQGRFRGNLSGKRVDFSGRTVIGPDPNLSVEQVAVPEIVAKILTVPEIVTEHNIEMLRLRIKNGTDIHPGANYYQPKDQMKRYLKFVSDREKLSKNLKIGDLVERHLQDNDVVLFNRQPSLHKLSIMAHYVKVRPWKTFRFNECVCTPYNADFDGDEMNLHVPQTQEARAEAMTLMGVRYNLITPRNGQPLIAATQDFITGSYLLSRKDSFFTRSEFCQICTYMSDGLIHFDLPQPALMKPVCLWTGKQVFSVLMRPNQQDPVKVHLETKNRSYIKSTSQSPYLDLNDGWVVIMNSQLLSGVIDKSIVGDGNKDSIFYTVLKDVGAEYACQCMNRLAKLCSRWLANYGFSIGIEDVTPGEQLKALREEVIQEGYRECDQYIKQHQQGTLVCQPGCNIDQTLEAQLSGRLSRIRDTLGGCCIQELNRHNAPLIMSVCGSKGSKINVCQMVACVGQQIINGKRVGNGFDQRTLPHFPKYDTSPNAKGFVHDSFYTGLTPTEFFFHAASGREGLVDTAVKTAETGYMQRRLMKALEDLCVMYDYTVRNASGQVIQFEYGEDLMDPAMMEREEGCVDLHRVLLRSQYEAVVEQRVPQYRIGSELDTRLSRDQLLDYLNKKSVWIAPYTTHSFTQSLQQYLLSTTIKLTPRLIDLFYEHTLKKYTQSKIEPGTAVGALAAQSIGEPGTQMTLKTFHFAGVASMNVTLGVPRIKEIINASKEIQSPIITARLQNDGSERVARIVKGRMEVTTLGEVLKEMKTVLDGKLLFLELCLDLEQIRHLGLEITLHSIALSIQKSKLKIQQQSILCSNGDVIKIQIPYNDYYLLQKYKRLLPKVVCCGIPSIQRAVINNQEGKPGTYEILAEGYGLQQIMTLEGIVGTQTTSNHIIEVYRTLGIEAALSTIIQQIQYTMSNHGISINSRHLLILAERMCWKGEVMGITRFGIGKMKDGVLGMASFEKTSEWLFEGAVFGKRDMVEGVSECIILGVPMRVGTGLFKVVQQVDKEVGRGKRKFVFDLEEYHPQLETFLNK